MGYITNADIEERVGNAAYVQLADDDGNGVADVGIVDEIRLGAEGEVNSYLAKRFQTPIDLGLHPSLSDLLVSISLDLAEYRLRSRRPPVSEDARRRHTQAVDWLARVSDGRLELPALSAVAASSTKGTIASTTGEARVLSREELSDV